MNYLLVLLGGLIVFNLFVEPPVEHSIIYFPTNDQYQENLSINHEDVFIKTADEKTIHAWFVKNENSDKVILYFHGNGGNITYRVPKIMILHEIPINVFIIDYHGYGKSEGQPSEENLYLDAQAAYNYLTKQKKYLPSQIIVMGSSLGGAVAVHLAAQEKVGGVVLESTFTSVEDMARRNSFLFARPIIWIRSDFNSLKKIGSIKAPLLIAHSKEDEMIPYEMSQALYEKAAEPKKLLLFEKGEHNDLLLLNQEYVNSLKQMVK